MREAILELWRQGWSFRRIARELAVHRKTVPPHVQLAEKGSNWPNPTAGTDRPAEAECGTYLLLCRVPFASMQEAYVAGWQGREWRLRRAWKMALMRSLLEKWGLTSLRINVGFLDAEFKPGDSDRQAAWELYVELLTRTTTQPLPADEGDDEAALKSVHDLFPVTRGVLKQHGSDCKEFAKIAIVVLNQVVRPFTTKWHRRCLRGDLGKSGVCAEFRSDLSEVQVALRKYTRLLSDMAMVEDLTTLEEMPGAEEGET